MNFYLKFGNNMCKEEKKHMDNMINEIITETGCGLPGLEKYSQVRTTAIGSDGAVKIRLLDYGVGIAGYDRALHPLAYKRILDLSRRTRHPVKLCRDVYIASNQRRPRIHTYPLFLADMITEISKIAWDIVSCAEKMYKEAEASKHEANDSYAQLASKHARLQTAHDQLQSARDSASRALKKEKRKTKKMKRRILAAI